MPRRKTNRIDLRVDDAFFARIESWRLSQPGPPSLTAAMTHLINHALDALAIAEVTARLGQYAPVNTLAMQGATSRRHRPAADE